MSVPRYDQSSMGDWCVKGFMGVATMLEDFTDSGIVLGADQMELLRRTRILLDRVHEQQIAMRRKVGAKD